MVPHGTQPRTPAGLLGTGDLGSSAAGAGPVFCAVGSLSASRIPLPVREPAAPRGPMSTVMDTHQLQTGSALPEADGHHAQAHEQAQGAHPASQLGMEVGFEAPAQPPHEALGESCFFQYELGDILLQAALGHSLPWSQSPFAQLPREVIQHHVARHVRSLYMDDLGGRGLLTPVQEAAASPDAPAPAPAPQPLSRQPPALVRRVKVRRQTNVMPGVKRRFLTFADFADGGSQQASSEDEADMHTRVLLSALARFRSESPKDVGTAWPRPVSCDLDTN